MGRGERGEREDSGEGESGGRREEGVEGQGGQGAGAGRLKIKSEQGERGSRETTSRILDEQRASSWVILLSWIG